MRIKYLITCILIMAIFGTAAACKKGADNAGGSGGGSGSSSGTAPAEGDFKGITASSALSEKGKTYSAANLMDGGDASWCEGKKDDGIGESFTLTFGQAVTLKTFRVRNGFGNPKFYSANNRVKKLLVNGIKVKLKDDAGFQTVTLPSPVTGETIKFEIGSVHQGAKFRDTCITEIAIDGVKAPAAPAGGGAKWPVGKWETPQDGKISFAADGTCNAPDYPGSTNCRWTADEKSLTLSLTGEGGKQIKNTYTYDKVRGCIYIAASGPDDAYCLVK